MNHKYFYILADNTATTSTTSYDYAYTSTWWVDKDIDPLWIPCEREIKRFLRRPHTCGKSLHEHMEHDLGHTYMKDRKWNDEIHSNIAY